MRAGAPLLSVHFFSLLPHLPPPRPIGRRTSPVIPAKLECLPSTHTNANVERFIQTIQQECLDHFVILGHLHFDYLVKEYLAHYHQERPHQSLDNDPLVQMKKCGRPTTKRGRIESELLPLNELRCRQRLGGLGALFLALPPVLLVLLSESV
jgi:Integrase core domain